MRPAERRAARKPYTAPAIVSEHRLEAHASISPNSAPYDPINQPNEYGL